MGQQVCQLILWLMFSGIVLVLFLTGAGPLAMAPAAAAIRQLEEAPGQIVYQSRQTLRDQHNNSWQTIAFKSTALAQKRYETLQLRLRRTLVFPRVIPSLKRKIRVLESSIVETKAPTRWASQRQTASLKQSLERLCFQSQRT